jgi:release factor glutamine methyltransferase
VQLRQALQQAITKLEAAGIDAARLSAEVLAFHVLGYDRAYLYAHPERLLTEAELAQYESLVERRAAGEPLQYLTGHQEFWGADFLVTPSVLIPRPETEHLVEAVLELVRAFAVPRVGNEPTPGHPISPQSWAYANSGPPEEQRLKIIDVGTGSGAIAVSLARELPNAEVYAVDLSSEALDVARRNAERLGARVQFAQSDVLDSVVRDASFDFVVSNPPYVGLNEADKVQSVVKDYEPHMALFAGVEGLAVIRRLIPQSCDALRPGGWLLMEIGYSQSEAVMALLAGWDKVHAIADLAGIPRVIAAQKPLT